MNNISRFNRFVAMLGCLLVIAGFFFMDTDRAYAAEADRSVTEISSYRYDGVVRKDHSYIVTVRITVNASRRMDQYDIRIPNSGLRISDVKVRGADFAVKADSHDEIVTITSSKDLKAGKHTYVVDYKANAYADDAPKYDLLYMNVLPYDIEVPIRDLRIRVAFPKDFDWDDMQYFAGQYGTQDVSGKLNVSAENDMITITGQSIPQNFGVTLKDQLPEGYWHGEMDSHWTANAMMYILAGGLGLILILWLIGGRDPKFKPEKVTMPISDASAAEAGYLMSGRVTAKEIVTLIIDLAAKGAVKITENRAKSYDLYKGKEPAGEERYIRNAWNTLFEDVYDGRPLEMEDIGSRMQLMMSPVGNSIASGFAGNDMRTVTKLSKIFRIVAIVLVSAVMAAVPVLCDIHDYAMIDYTRFAVVGLVTAAGLLLFNRGLDTRYSEQVTGSIAMAALGTLMLLAALFVNCRAVYGSYNEIPMAAAVAVFLIAGTALVYIMKSRAKDNARIAHKIYSLLRFMNRAKKQDIEEIMKEYPDYYYMMMPYAYRFGLMNKWAEKFKDIDVPEAGWYQSNVRGFGLTDEMQHLNTENLARAVERFGRTLESEYNTMVRRRRRG